MNLKANLTIAAIMMTLMCVACGGDDPKDDPPIEKEEMFPFLKVGNEWEYSAYVSPMEGIKITIDSIEIINKNESKYFGSYKRWLSHWDNDTNIEVNQQLFHLKDSILTVSFISRYSNFIQRGSMFNYNWVEGQVIDSLDGYNEEGIKQWIPIIVSKGSYTVNWWHGTDTYTDCIMFKGGWQYSSMPTIPMSWSGDGIEAVLSNKYGLIFYENWYVYMGTYGGPVYRLINKNF